MNWADYQPGKRVVCLLDYRGTIAETAAILSGGAVPVKGTVYTVRMSAVCPCGCGRLVIRLQEIVNPPVTFAHGVDEPAWLAHRFRPVDETKLDQFRKHLTDIPTAVPA